MRNFKFIILLLMAFGLVQCASKEPQPLPLPDVTEGAAPSADPLSADVAPSDAIAAGETSEKDLASGMDSAPKAQTAQAAPTVPDEFSDSPVPQEAMPTPPPLEEAPPPPAPVVTEAPAPAPMPETSTADTGSPATVTGLDFKANDNGGTVVVKTNREVTFTTRRNDKNNQFIIELQNTRVPKKFTRPLNTKEFPGAIASVNAYQSKGSQNITRVILQLREAVEPAVSQNGRSISVAAVGGGDSMNVAPVAKNETPAPEDEGSGGEETVQVSADELDQPTKADGRIMENKSFDSFLLGQTKFYGRKISIEVTNQDVREVFKFISEESGMNIILDDDVQGKVTMKLKKVPWDQILAIILQSRQLGYVKNGSILRIASLKTLAADSQNARKVIDAQKELQPIRVQVFPMSYAKVEEFSTQVTNLLSPRGKVAADKRTNTLIVSDIAESLSKVKTLAAKLDTQTPQVLIEAKIIEARDSFEKVVGVDWGTPNGSAVLGQGAGNAPLNLGFNTASGYNPTQTTGTNLALSLGKLDVLGDITATLQLLEKEGQIKLISSPRIVALDRQEAQVEQTTQFPYVTATASVAGAAPVQSVNFKDVKLELKVKPQITVGGGIILEIEITRELKGDDTTTSAGIVPSVEKRYAKTQVLVENGDTMVLAGIYQSDVNDSETGVPILSKIPLIGALFKQTHKTKTKNELVMFLTPRILNREKAFVKNGDAM